MKQIDEVQLLLAVGEVGDDLLLRAEQRPTSSLRRVRHRWGGALAACLCLALVLTTAMQLPGIEERMNAFAERIRETLLYR